MKTIIMKINDFTAYADLESGSCLAYWVENAEGKTVYQTNNIRDAVQMCTYEQMCLDNARYLDSLWRYNEIKRVYNIGGGGANNDIL